MSTCRFTNTYGNHLDIDVHKVRSVRSYTYAAGQTTVTRIEYDGGDSENLAEPVEEVESQLAQHGLRFIRLHDVHNSEFRIVCSKIRNVGPYTYGLGPTTVTRIEYDDGDTLNVTEPLEAVRAVWQG